MFRKGAAEINGQLLSIYKRESFMGSDNKYPYHSFINYNVSRVHSWMRLINQSEMIPG